MQPSMQINRFPNINDFFVDVVKTINATTNIVMDVVINPFHFSNLGNLDQVIEVHLDSTFQFCPYFALQGTKPFCAQTLGAYGFEPQKGQKDKNFGEFSYINILTRSFYGVYLLTFIFISFLNIFCPFVPFYLLNPWYCWILQGTKGRDKRRDIGQNSFFYGHI
jgi:hypothetical protein